MLNSRDMTFPAISLSKIRELDLSAASAAGCPLHLSAASGLVGLNAFIYVVADDELHLGVFSAEDRKPGHLIRLFDGALPESKLDRKKQKPDFEALTLLPAYGNYPHGALFALGSGSTRNRRTGALFGLDAQGALRGSPRSIDLSPILASLDDEFDDLNIEGAVVTGRELRLFQRGNKRHAENAIIRFQLSAVLDVLNAGRAAAIRPSAIDPVDLGQIDGIPLCFTDAAALPEGDMIFTAVAEDTDNAYDDGVCVGAAVGIVDKGGHLRCLRQLDHAHKVEGVDARMDGDDIKLLLVTDADDPDVPACLFGATLKR